MLFNKSGTGNQEMKDLLGFISKAITFSNFNSFIPLAERDVYPILGQEIITLAQDHYNSDHYKADDQQDPALILLDELVRCIQVPVALHAYRRYVPSNDLTHNDVGRQISVTEENKPAFEWQIERDNQNLLSLAYENMDLLLEFLERNSKPFSIWETLHSYKAGSFTSNDSVIYYCLQDHDSGIFADDLAAGKWKPVYTGHIIPQAWETETEYAVNAYIIHDSAIYQCLDHHQSGVFADDLAAGKWLEVYDGSTILFEWSGSAAYISSKSLIINSASQLNEFFSINRSSRLYFTLVPILGQLQEHEIIPCFLQEKFSAIRQEILSGEFTDVNKGLLDKARAALAFLTLATAVIQLQPEVFPEGIFNNYFSLGGSSKNPAGIADRNRLSNTLQEIGRNRLRELQETISKINSEAIGEEYQADDLLPGGEIDDKFLSL